MEGEKSGFSGEMTEIRPGKTTGSSQKFGGAEGRLGAAAWACPTDWVWACLGLKGVGLVLNKKGKWACWSWAQSVKKKKKEEQKGRTVASLGVEPETRRVRAGRTTNGTVTNRVDLCHRQLYCGGDCECDVIYVSGPNLLQLLLCVGDQVVNLLVTKSSSCNMDRPQDSGGGRWYFSRKEIEEHSPSRRDGIDLKKETYLRKSYCTFLQDLGMRLKV
ncbi:hypothetical protein F0562_019494 [Nyssa sinensis]|uniref:Uncharacterized protein n=1 Tax=Nyssa sinensis TaxID=561372 RepID=A0A5J5BP81_9ASTE|nr:hypothetical protein F0562_019494 [Nyssa sinensis]